MTEFENLLNELGVKVQYETVRTATVTMLQYKGLSKAIYDIAIDVMFDDNISSDDWSKETKAKALKVFPYLNH